MLRDDSLADVNGIDIHRWKSGPSMQPLQPASAAAALVTMYGPTRALQHAEAMKGQQVAHSNAAVFYDQVARDIERGIVAAKAAGPRG